MDDVGTRVGKRCALALVSVASVASVALVACQPSDEISATPVAVDTLPLVYAVNYPLAWMAGRIGGEAIEVVFPAPADVDPAHWQPTPETILRYQGADLVLLNGAGYAAWIQFAALSSHTQVDSSGRLAARFVAAGQISHSHGPGGEHDHGDVASHTWLDPTFASGQAEAIARALERTVSTAPDGLEGLQADLAHLDARLAAAFGGFSDAGVVYSHPVYQYLNERYELGGWSVSWEPDEDPGEAEWQQFTRRLDDQPASVMLWERDPLPTTASRLRKIGVVPVVFETGAQPPAHGDYLTLMQNNIDRLTEVHVGRTEARISGDKDHQP